MCRAEKAPPPCPVDVPWLASEGRALGAAAGTPRRPLIAGGAGLVGSNLLALLGNSPRVEKIRVVDMFPPSKVVIAGFEDKVEFVKGRFASGEYERLKEAAAGCDCVFMVFTPNVHRAKLHEFYETNVDGARELTKACIDAGVGRIVYASSIAVTSMMVHSVNQSESVPFPPIEAYRTPYDISKRQGEELILEAAAGRVRACSLRFGGVLLGPRDFFFDYVWPTIPGLIFVPMGNPVDWMDGRDVSRALLMAAQGLAERPKDVDGEAFFCTGTSMSPGQLAQITARHLQYPFLKLPMAVLPVVMLAVYCRYQLRRALGLSVPGVREDQIFGAAQIQKTFDNSKVRRVLGFEAKVSMEDAVSRVVGLYLKERDLSPGSGLFLRFVGGVLLGTSALAYAARAARR